MPYCHKCHRHHETHEACRPLIKPFTVYHDSWSGLYHLTAKPENVDDACDALKALRDEEATERVELAAQTLRQVAIRLCIRGDEVWLEEKGNATGQKWQRYESPHGEEYASSFMAPTILAAYRAGLERGK